MMSEQEAVSPPSVEERLKVYGLKERKGLVDLRVADGENIRISVRDPGRYRPNAYSVKVKSVEHLKQMIGTPDEVIRTQGVCCPPEGLTETLPATFKELSDLSSSQRETLRLASDAFLYGLSSAVEAHRPAINLAVNLSAAAIIGIITFNDITVQRNGVLTVDPSVSVLFANKVRIELGGRIRVLGPLKIDASSIEGDELPFLQVATTVQQVRRTP
jgi:hypothetical protein